VVRIRNNFDIFTFSKKQKQGHKLKLILESGLQAPPAWSNLVPIPNAEADTIIHFYWMTMTDLMAKKEIIVDLLTFLHILKLGMYLAILLSE
jgi:hypothetical protein